MEKSWCNKEHPNHMVLEGSSCGKLFTNDKMFFKITEFPSRRVEIDFETGKRLLLCSHHFWNDQTQIRRHPIFKQIADFVDKQDFQRKEDWIETLNLFLGARTASPFAEARILGKTHPYLACELVYDALSVEGQRNFLDTLLGKMLNSSIPMTDFWGFKTGTLGSSLHIDKVDVHLNGWLLTVWENGCGYYVVWKNNEYVGENGTFKLH